MYCLSLRLISQRPPSTLLLLLVPKSRGGNANNAAAKPPPCIPMQQTPSVSTQPHVIPLLVHHYCSSDGRHATEQRGLGLQHRVNFPFLGLKVSKVSRVVGVMHTIWIVVAPGGGAPLTQVSILMDVNGFRLWVALCWEAT